MNNFDKKNWQKINFGEIAKEIRVAEHEPLKNDLNRYVGLEHIESENLHIFSWGDISDGTTFSRKFVKGQVLFGRRRAYLKKAALVDFDGICSGDILVFEAIQDKLLPELLPFIVQNDKFFQYAVDASAGSLSPRVKFKDLAKFELMLPKSLDEQKKLADLLWAGDELTTNYLRLKSNLETLEKCYVKSIFNDFDKQSFVMLGDICEISGGSTPSTKNSNYWDGDINWLTPKEITNFKSKYLYKTEKKITKEGLKSISNNLYPIGTVAMSTRATIGNMIIMGEEMSTNQGFTNFVCGKGILNEYLYVILKFLTPSLISLGSGSTFLEISKSDIKRFKIPLPSINIQKQIISTIEIYQNRIEQAEAISTQLKELSNSIKNQIFS